MACVTIYAIKGLYHWQLCDGPDGAFEYEGWEPTLEACFEEILRAQRALAYHLTGETHTLPSVDAHDAAHSAAIAQAHTPDGNLIPLQQDIPSMAHTASAT